MKPPQELPAGLRHLIGLLALLWIPLGSALPGVAAEGPATRSFFLPAGSAAQVLKQFSEQSGRGVVFVTETVQDVRTNAVQGDLTPAAALRQLLAGTVLVAEEDAKTGAFAVRKGVADPNGSRAAPIPATRAAPNPAPAADLREVIELSPFVVDTSRDVGFVATSSLAGGRLAGDLRDTPAAYSVITREFIDALGLKNMTEATQWAVNSTTQPDDGRGEIFTTITPISFRGISGNTQQRNFFPARIDFDSYNLDRFDYARGPNSILFGNGSIGGTANVVTKRAQPERATSAVSLALGSWNDARFTIDLNRPLTAKAALRLNAVVQDRDSWRDRDFERKMAATLAGTYRFSRRSEWRVEAEVGRTDRSTALSTLGDRFTGWDGISVYDAALTTLPSDANARGVGRASATTIVYAQASGLEALVNYGLTAITLAGNANAAVPIGGQIVNGAGLTVAGQNFLEQLNLPANRFDRALAGSRFRYPSRAFTTSYDGPLIRQDFVNAETAFTHVVGDRLYFEAAGNFSFWKPPADISLGRSIQDTLIDINRNLPTGARNPNFLQPYNEGERTYTVQPNESLNYRAAAAYVLDGTRLGDFRFNLLGTGRRTHSERRFYTYVAQIDRDPRNWSTNNLVRVRYYWDQASRPPLGGLGRLPYLDPIARTTTPVDTGYILDTRSAGNQRERDDNLDTVQAAASAKLFQGRLHLLGAIRRDWYDARAQTGAMRMDYPANWDTQTSFYAPPAPPDFFSLMYVPKSIAGAPTGLALPALVRPRDSAGFGLPQYANDRFADDFSPPNVSGAINTTSFGGVLHVMSWLSLIYNQAGTFNPVDAKQRVNGTIFGPQVSRGRDAGVRLNLWQGRLVASILRYTGRESGEVISTGASVGFPAAIPSTINTILQTNVIGDQSSGGRNKRGFEDVIDYSDVRDRESEGFELDAVANLTTQWRLLWNIAVPRAYQTNAYSDTRAFLAQHEGTLRQIVLDGGGLVDAKGAASVDLTVPINQRSPDVDNAVRAWNNLQVIKANLNTGRQKVTRLTESTGNFFSDYTFRGGRLGGLRLGAGVNYRGRTVIGYRGSDTIADPANPSVAIDDPKVDSFTPVYTGSYSLVTATIGYKVRLAQRRSLDLSLRIANLLNEGDPIYYNTAQRPPGGTVTSPARVATPLAYYYQTPRSFLLSATLDF
jgi:outer membrane receptor protein involved in Fe transport